jgi:hypothetical protein
MWLDSDAFFTKFTKEKFDNFISILETKSMIICEDMPPWKSPFNAGSFVVKNDEIGHKILTEWIKRYDASKWEFNGKWTTETKWAGEYYEQGAFVKYILNEYKEHIQMTHYHVLNNIVPEYDILSITAHLAANYKHDKKLCDAFFPNHLNKIKDILLGLFMLF